MTDRRFIYRGSKQEYIAQGKDLTQRLDNVEPLPIWKADASAEDRLSELAIMAGKHPERFKRMVVFYEEDIPVEKGQRYGNTLTRYVTAGCDTTYALGVIEKGKEKLLRWVFDSAE